MVNPKPIKISVIVILFVEYVCVPWNNIVNKFVEFVFEKIRLERKLICQNFLCVILTFQNFEYLNLMCRRMAGKHSY